LGAPSLVAALVLSVLGLIAFTIGGLRESEAFTGVGRRALQISFGFVGLAGVALVTALYAHDFSLSYVARYSSRSLSGPYMLGAFWGGMEGSLLFWTLLLTGFATVALDHARASTPRLVAWAGAVLSGVSVFFLMLLVLPASPFTASSPVPADGSGLNPLLQSPGMMIHPPLLYTGFVAFSIPFAFAMSALLSKRLDTSWFTSTRRWTLFAWSALSIGIVLGGAWAYTELGWGGYWAWDPVENASFMPWLTATAFLHSVVIQEKRQMLKIWNVSLILITYALAIFGTFLTRSGILSSIHTFTEGPIGKWFLPFLALMLLGGLGIVLARLNELKSQNRFDSLVSRESAFLANNVLFVAAAFTVLWGTIYPIVAEVVSGVRLSVGPPFFNSVFIPLGLAIIGLTGIGPLISWRRMSKGAFTRIVRIPLLVGAVPIGVLFATGVRSVGALLAFGLCAFTTTAICTEFVRGSRLHRQHDGVGMTRALTLTVKRNRRRYGGYIVHLGVILIVIGLAGAAFRTERHALLSMGDEMKIGDYTLTYAARDQETSAEKQINTARIDVMKEGVAAGALYPQRNFHLAQEQPQSEVAIRTGPVEDLYVVITSFDQDGDAAVRAFVNPLTWWIWVGAAVMLGGMAILLSSPAPARASARVRGEIREPAAATR
jgi:cytochrome c-type biogenesis protein CcmF